jgi:hypothetical protein
VRFPTATCPAPRTGPTCRTMQRMVITVPVLSGYGSVLHVHVSLPLVPALADSRSHVRMFLVPRSIPRSHVAGGLPRTWGLPGSLIRATIAGLARRLLPVTDQNLQAALAEPGAVLLEARQDDHIAVIHMGAAITRHIARAGILPLLGRSHRGHQNKRNKEKKSDHVGMPGANGTRNLRAGSF